MKRRFGKIIIGGMTGMLLGCISVLAISKTTVKYHLFSEKAAIHVQYYTEKNGRIVLLEEEDENVLPGEFISRIPMIQNEGIDCYIRAKVDITSEKEASVPITLEHIVGMDEKWISIGDYFYYKDVLLEDDDVGIFDGICTPLEWVNAEDCGNQWEVNVKVDAIQAKYLEPDFQSADPWGEQKNGFEILNAKEDEALEDNNINSSFDFTIESGVNDFQIEKKETFQDMGDFVPGDVKRHEITIRNLNKRERTINIRMEVPKNNKLLAEMELTVVWAYENKETVLYQGTILDAYEIFETESLNMKGSSEGVLCLCISLPEIADNTWAALEGNFHLVFSEEQIEQGNSNVQEDLLGWPEDSEISDELGEDFAVQTGDDSKLWNGIVGLGIGVCLFFLCLWKGKRGSYDS